MATLTIGDIRKRGNTKTLADKIFKVGENNLFSTEEGAFRATGVLIGNEKFGEWEYTTGNITRSNALMSKNLQYFIEGTAGSLPIELLGSYPPSRAKASVLITKVIKTEEFGGQIGEKENKGIRFERDFQESLLYQMGTRNSKGSYPKAAEGLINKIKKVTGKKGALNSTIRGGENQPRPLGAGPLVLPNNHREHGEKLTDIDLQMTGNTTIPLSLKFGATLTFMNSGVSKIFTTDEIDAGTISTPIGKDIENMLALDPQLFGETFSRFEQGFKRTSQDITTKVNRKKLQKFLETAVGSNYWMVHGKENGTVSFWFMDSRNIRNLTAIEGNIMIYYGGKAGPAKRVDIEFSTKYFDFKINVRSKGGTVYPTHMMLDYKSKNVAGWKTTVLG